MGFIKVSEKESKNGKKPHISIDQANYLKLGDSRKYPYHTMDGFKDFRRGGGIHDYGILKALGGYLRFEIQRYGGIPQVGFLE